MPSITRFLDFVRCVVFWKEHLELDLLPSLVEKVGGVPTKLVSLERAGLSHWGTMIWKDIVYVHDLWTASRT
jgi:hypothetical protein